MDRIVAFGLGLFLAVSGCTSHLGAPEDMGTGTASSASSIRRGVAYVDGELEPGDRRLAEVWIPDTPGPRPAVLLIHGGGWIGGEPSTMEDIARELASRGYVAVNVGYRLAPEHHHPAQLEDCREALRWIHRNAERLRVDPERIGVFGYSAGAHLALLLGTTGGEDVPRVAAVVAGAAPTNLSVFPKSPLVRKLMGVERDEAPERWAEASPLTHVSSDDAPTFLYHGTFDLLVPVEHSEWMREALVDAGVPTELYLVRGLGHYLTFLVDPGATQAAIDFLDRRL